MRVESSDESHSGVPGHSLDRRSIGCWNQETSSVVRKERQIAVVFSSSQVRAEVSFHPLRAEPAPRPTTQREKEKKTPFSVDTGCLILI